MKCGLVQGIIGNAKKITTKGTKFWPRRAKFLYVGAKLIVEKYNGKLPSTAEELLKIPGIGKYTAGNYFSFYYNQKFYF